MTLSMNIAADHDLAVEKTKPKKLLAIRLLKVIFSIYLMVTIVVTLVQMYAEYLDVKEQVSQEVINIQDLFYPAFSAALWNYDDRQMHSILQGMVEIDVIKGIKIVDTTQDDLEMAAMGMIAHGQGWEIVNSDGTRKGIEESVYQVESFSRKIFAESKSLGRIEVGELILYSDSEVVINKIKYGVILIVINSVIKTIALWFLFVFFISRKVGRPILAVVNFLETENDSRLSDNAKDKALIVANTKHQDELGFLCRSVIDRSRAR